MAQMRPAAAADPISALTALLSPDGALDRWCRFCYELRLHRARGYGALKAILDILADEEPLTLTEISHAPAPHAGLDQGLPVVARGRRPGDVARRSATASPTRCCALGPPALPADAARPKTTSRARCSATRCARVCRSRGARPAPVASPSAGGRRRGRREDARAGASSRSTETQVELGLADRRPAGRHAERDSSRHRSASRAASCSASFFARPVADAEHLARHHDLDVKILRWSGPARRRRGTRAAGGRAPAAAPAAPTCSRARTVGALPASIASLQLAAQERRRGRSRPPSR